MAIERSLVKVVWSSDIVTETGIGGGTTSLDSEAGGANSEV